MGLWRTLLAALLAFSSAAHAADAFARAFVVEIDGVRRSQQRADEPLAPASLTKIMSGLLLVESGRDLEEVVTVSRTAVATSGSRLRLRAGERLRAGDLLTAMLVASSNDACRALAEWHSGSEAVFVERMNARARALQLVHSHFVNACGLDAEGHRASAADLARLARVAMTQPAFAQRAGLAKASVRTLDGGRTFDFDSHNLLLGRSLGVMGVKSGYTNTAGRCLVAMARRDGHEVLLVMLNAPNRWWDAHRAIDYAFSRAPQFAR